MLPGKPSAAAMQKLPWQLLSTGTPSMVSGATGEAVDLQEEGKYVSQTHEGRAAGTESRQHTASVFRLGNPSSTNSHLLLYNCRTCILRTLCLHFLIRKL